MVNTSRGLIVVVGLLIGCSEKPAPGPVARPHIFFLLLDTLRADHLGLYGYERDTSPALDQFAKSAVVFERAQSQAPCTFPSANSILTGRYPGHFMLQPERRVGIPSGIATLPSLLQDDGYETLAISGSPIVRASKSKHNPEGGFDAGFGAFDESCLWHRADCIHARLFERLDPALASGKPIFVYLHYMDAHDPYVLPAGHELVFASEYEGEKPEVAAGRPGLAKLNDVELDDADIRHLLDLYDERIRYLDGKLAELFEALEARGLLDSSVVVIASDHGEQFDEHGNVAHCNALYREELDTPLILRLPDGPSGRRRRLVSNIDIAPTLLDYAGLGGTAALRAMDGRTLRADIEATSPSEERLAFAAWGRAFSVRSERFKLISFVGRRRAEMFDLAENPAEVRGRPVDAVHQDDKERLARELRDWLANRSGLDPERAATAGEITLEQLRALGYLP